MSSTLTQVDDCSGFFLDSGGGTGSYGSNESFTTTICPQGNSGTHVQLIFSGPQINAGDELCFFDGPDILSPSLGCASDFSLGGAFIIQATAPNVSGCLTLTFNSNASGDGDGWSADINCIPSCQTILSIIDSSDPVAVPLDTGWIDICPGDRIFFTGAGEYPQDGAVYNHSDLTSNFAWDFGDGNNTLGPNVSHVYNEPGGYIVQLTITDQLGCENTNFVNQRIRVAPKPNFELGFWPGQICAGDTVQLNAMVDSMDIDHTVSVLPSAGSFQTAGIRSDSLPLPDGNGSSYLTTISFSDFSPGQVLTDINDLLGIYVNMEHSWMRDLQISLTCPNGQSIMLHNHPGQLGGEVFLGIPYENDEGFFTPIPGTGYEYGWQSNPDYNYTWIEYANMFLPNILPSGTYNSYEPLSDLLGCPLNGDWTIEVTDLWSIDNGYIFSWAIDFHQSLFPALETFTPSITTWQWDSHPSIFFEQTDTIAGSPGNAGEVAYSFIVEDEFGCSWDTTLNIQVLPFTHPDCHNCADLLQPFPDTVICFGDSVEIGLSTPQSEGAVTFESYDDYEIGAGNHPPAFPYYSTININSINPTVITNPLVDIVSVCLDLETDFDADIRLFLVAPNGQMLELSTNNGGSADNYSQTCFTPTAIVPITAGTAPFTGDFQPEGSWNILNNAPINGDWSLQVSDQFGINAFGNLNWWSIAFRSDNDVLFNWSPDAALSCEDCPNPTVIPTANGTYSIEATDLFGCVANESVTINVLNSFIAPNVFAAQQAGGQVLITWDDSNPGLDYEVNINGTGWQPSNNGLLSHLVTGLNIGEIVNAEIRAIVSGGACDVGIGVSSITYFLCSLEAVLNSQGPYAVSCNGLCDESVQVSVFNGVSPFVFDVTNQTTGDNSILMNGNLIDLCPGIYQVIVSDDDACMDTVDFEVGNQLPVVVTAVEESPVSCFGGSDGCASVTAFGGVGGFSFLWNDPNMSIGTPICGLQAGPVIVTATDQNGCQGSGVVTITEPDLLELDLNASDVNCTGGNDGSATAMVTGGVMPYNYLWSGGDTPNQQTTGMLTANNYSVIVEDANGCQVSGNIDVGEPQDGLLLSVTTFNGCFNLNENEAMASVSGGTLPYSYLWSPSGGTAATADNLPNGDFTVVVTDGSGCTIQETVTLDDLDEVDVAIAFDLPSCNNGSDGAIAANIVTGGTGTGYTYLWSTGDMDDFINGLQGGQTYAVTVEDSQGCEGVASLLLQDPPAMEASAQITDAFCNGVADGNILISTVENNQGNVTYQWDASALNQITQMANDLGAGNYSVVITDTAGCSITQLYSVGEPTPIAVDFETTDNDCFGGNDGSIDSDVMGGTPGYSFLWSNGAATAKLTDISSDMYYVTITDLNGCVKEDSIFLNQPAVVTINLMVDDVSCFGEMDGSISIEAIGGIQPYTYSLDNQQFFGSQTLIALTAGDYPVFVMDANECTYSTNTTITEPPPISVTIIGNGLDVSELTIQSGEEILLDADVSNAIGLVTYSWTAGWCGTLTCPGDSTDCGVDIDCSNPVAFPDFANDYFLFVEDENGCQAEDQIQIQVRKTRSVVVPTGFTPNGDGLNEFLPVHGRSGTMINLFQVFDRWGELLFEDTEIPINDITRGWDGTFKSQDMPPGVYVWYIEVEYSDGMEESFKGETTLIR